MSNLVDGMLFLNLQMGEEEVRVKYLTLGQLSLEWDTFGQLQAGSCNLYKYPKLNKRSKKVTKSVSSEGEQQMDLMLFNALLLASAKQHPLDVQGLLDGYGAKVLAPHVPACPLQSCALWVAPTPHHHPPHLRQPHTPHSTPDNSWSTHYYYPLRRRETCSPMSSCTTCPCSFAEHVRVSTLVRALCIWSPQVETRC